MQGLQPRRGCVDGGDVRVSPHSRLRRQCGVIEVVTATRLISPTDAGCASTHDAYRRGVKPDAQGMQPRRGCVDGGVDACPHIVACGANVGLLKL